MLQKCPHVIISCMLYYFSLGLLNILICLPHIVMSNSCVLTSRQTFSKFVSQVCTFPFPLSFTYQSYHNDCFENNFLASVSELKVNLRGLTKLKIKEKLENNFMVLILVLVMPRHTSLFAFLNSSDNSWNDTDDVRAMGGI